jgi:TctA family transporter
MTDFLANIQLGLSVAAGPDNLLFCFIGAALGTAIGILPGLGPVATISILLPVTFHIQPTAALIMLAGIYYGAQYGSSTTAILMRLPGETSSVVTCLDGYAMAQNGRAGSALVIAALASFFAGIVATALIVLAAPPLAALGASFGAAEYFALMVLGLVTAVVFAQGSLVRALGMIVLGLVLGIAGTDIDTGTVRFTFEIPDLFDGLQFAAVAMGLFGVAEIICNLETGEPMATGRIARIGAIWPNRQEIRAAAPAAVRGTALGTVLGVLPGGGAILSSFAAYAVEKYVSRTPDRFGNGAVEGVAGPEAANNAGAQSSFIPMLTLGIPANAVMALMAGGMMIHGIVPGPSVMDKQPALFWGLIASMLIGNGMLLAINLPLVRVWVQLLRIPYVVLYPAILLFCAVGAYSLRNNPFDVLTTALFGAVGWVFLKLRCEPAPLLLAFVLGPLMEENFRRA